jgi:putative ABC transport system permease protein
MGTLIQDIRFAIRMLIRNPVFTVVVVLTLALGIGANTAIFSVVHAVLLRPLPFENPSRLVWGFGTCPLCEGAAISAMDFADYRAQNHVFTHLGAYGIADNLFNLTGTEKPEQVKGTLATYGFFEALGVRPLFGRSFLPSDEHVKEPQVIVLGNRMWKEHFGGDPAVIGRSVTLDGVSRTIVGVLPVDLPLFSDADLWIPAPYEHPQMASRGGHFLRVIGLLKPDVSLSQAQAELTTIARGLEKEYPNTDTGWGVRLSPLQTVLVGDVKPALLVLFGAVALVLLIACANVASLLLARNTVRQKEVAIRMALGAGRARLIRQMLTESILLACAGGATGILLANWSVVLLKGLGPESLPRLAEVGLNGTVLAFTAGIAALTGIIFGLAPALQATRRDLTQSFREGGASGVSRSRHRAHDALVVAEVALSLVVLIASGLLLNSFWRLIHVSPGFDATHVSTSQISLVDEKYRDNDDARTGFFNQLQDRVVGLPGVDSVGFISELPLSGEGNDTYFTLQEKPPVDPNDRDDADLRVVAGGYFRAMRIPLLAGRKFVRSDDDRSPLVVLINQPFAARYFPGENPIGRHLLIWEGKPNIPPREIVGVVGGNKHFAMQEALRSEMFIPQAQSRTTRLNLVVRGTIDRSAIALAVRGAVQAIDPDEATSSFRAMSDVISISEAGDRFNAILLGAFGGMALVLTAAGIFGVLSYLVTQRTHEIGLRMALGAQPGGVLRVVIGHAMRLTLLGVAIGLACALLATRWMASFLFTVKPADPLTFVTVVLVLAAAALMACYFPARRAMRVDPMVALRYE